MMMTKEKNYYPNLAKKNSGSTPVSDSTRIFPLTPTKQRHNKKKISGFDIETYDKNKKLYCASIYHNENSHEFFFDKDSIIEYFRKKRFWNSIISATNLSFDFMGIFYGRDEIKHFDFLFRGSDLIYAKTYVLHKKFYNSNECKELSENDKKNKKSIIFVDTMNYAKLSVERLGELIKKKKLTKPACLGRLPRNNDEKEELLRYNLRDSEISKKALEFFYDAFYSLGATPTHTIAGTSMSLFRNKYLDKPYFRHTDDVLLDIFEGYYGGRCEAVGRGYITDYKLYDINSLYPSVMLNDYPDPNTLRMTYKNVMYYIDSYHGMSLVDVSCPYMDYPLLSFRYDTKLLFPYGSFTGWYTHSELRKATEIGYTIKKVRKTYYYKDNCSPFRDFVLDMYKYRMKHSSEPMAYVAKILMNSFYGKFGQKFIDRDEWLPSNLTIEQIHRYKDIIRIGDFFRIKKDYTKPRAFCFPIWASYVTSYGRIKLHEWVSKYGAIYYDTDSMVTKKDIPSSSKLGGWKLENIIKKGYIIKPKFYGFWDDRGYGKVKVKGLGYRLKYEEFLDFIKDPRSRYDKFMKFKESVRRGFIPNEIQQVEKIMTLEDTKRDWDKKFSSEEFQFSRPLQMKNGKLYKPHNILHNKKGESVIKTLT